MKKNEIMHPGGDIKGVCWLILGDGVDYQSLCAFSHVWFIIQYSLHGET